MSSIRKRLTYANIVATIALFLALGGASYAAFKLPKKSVGTRQLKPESVTGAKVKTGSLPGSVLVPGSVAGNALKAGVLPNLSGYATKTELGNVGNEVKQRLGATVVVNKTIASSPIAPTGFAFGEVSCPSGYQAIAGGVSPSNIFSGKVSESAPAVGGKEPVQQPDGQSGPATGWFGAVTLPALLPQSYRISVTLGYLHSAVAFWILYLTGFTVLVGLWQAIRYRIGPWRLLPGFGWGR